MTVYTAQKVNSAPQARSRAIAKLDITVTLEHRLPLTLPRHALLAIIVLQVQLCQSDAQRASTTPPLVPRPSLNASHARPANTASKTTQSRASALWVTTVAPRRLSRLPADKATTNLRKASRFRRSASSAPRDTIATASLLQTT